MLAVITFCIVLSWLLIAAVCMGVGGLPLRWLGFSFSALDAMWTGFALIGAILQIYHFFRPVDLLTVYLVMSLGATGWIWNRATFVRRPFETGGPRWTGVVLCISAAAFIAFRAAAMGEHYDTGLYGGQALRWFTTYRLVPGLGNLRAQLGFNSSVLLWISALDLGPWRDLAHHLFDGFMIAGLIALVIPAALRVFRGSGISPSDWFLTFLLVPATIWAATGKIVGTNTDIPTSVVCLVGAAMLFCALDEECSEPGNSDTRAKDLMIAMLLFSLAVTFKISSAVFAFAGWATAFLKLSSLMRSGPAKKRKVALAVTLSAMIVLPWIGRGLVLTGYPFFPSAAFGIPVDWKVPPLITQFEGDFAQSFARVPDYTTNYAHGWAWVQPWFYDFIREREGCLIPLFLVAAGGVAGIIRMRRKEQGALPQWGWVLIPAVAGLIFWFLEAPALRFGEAAIWTTAATLGTFAAVQFLDQTRKIRTGLAMLLLVTVWAAHPRLLWSSNLRPSVGVRTFLRMPKATLAERQTSSGLKLYVPVETNQCWDAPLPCTPYFLESLHLREPGNLESGFAEEYAGKAANQKEKRDDTRE
jgi:hypothetical protein